MIKWPSELPLRIDIFRYFEMPRCLSYWAPQYNHFLKTLLAIFNRCLHAAPYAYVDKLNCLPTMNNSSEFREAHYQRPISEINWILENSFIAIRKSVNLESLIVAFEQQVYQFLIMNLFEYPIIYIPAPTFSQYPRLGSSSKSFSDFN